MSNENINLLYNKQFRLEIARLPNVMYFCQEVTIPSVSVNPVESPTPFTNLRLHGDHPVYNQLSLQFNVDEDLRNYEEILKWIEQYSTPTSFTGYTTQPNITSKQAHLSHYSDGIIYTATNKDNVNVQFVFENMFPIDLSELPLTITNGDPEPLVCTVVFSYLKFSIRR